MIPAGWHKYRIDEFGRVQSGRQRSPSAKGRMRKYLRVANVLDGYIDTSDVLEMPFTDKEYDRFLLKKGDILLNEGQSLELVGRSAIYNGDPPNCCFQNTLIRFTPGEKIQGRYAQHLFKFCLITGRFAAIASRTTSIAHLGVERFRQWVVPVPPLAEQEEISRIAEKWDRAIDLTERLIADKQDRRTWLMQQLLTGKRRLVGFDGEWREHRFGEFLTESRVAGSDGSTARKLTVKLYAKGVHPKEAKAGGGSQSTQYYIRSKGQFIYSKLDFLNGAFGIIPDDLDGYETTLDLPAFDVSARLNIRWLLYFVSREEFYSQQLGLANGGRKARRVNPRDFLSCKARIPERNEQDRIVSFLSLADREVEFLRAQLHALREQKKGLMQQLLTGKVRVNWKEERS